MNPVFDFFAFLTGESDTAAIVEWIVDRLPPEKIRNRLRRRLTNMLNSGAASRELSALVTTALDEQAATGFHEAIDAPFAAKRAQLEKEARAEFRPHIWIFHENNRPSSIAMFALADGVNRWQKLRLPSDIAEWPPAMQAEEVVRVVDAHRLKTQTSPFLGKITGYRYRPTFDSGFDVLPDGSLDTADRGKSNDPVAYADFG